MNRCTKRLFTLLLSLFTAGIAMRSSASATYVFNVDNRDPFGVLNLTKLIIKPDTTHTGIILDWGEYTIKIDPNHERSNWWQIRVYEICDEDGYYCKEVSSLWVWWPWDWISASWNTWEYCYLKNDWNLTCNNNKLEEAINKILLLLGIIAPSNDTITINQWWTLKWSFTLNGTSTIIDLDAGWSWISASGTTWYYCKLQNNGNLYCDWNSSNRIWWWSGITASGTTWYYCKLQNNGNLYCDLNSSTLWDGTWIPVSWAALNWICIFTWWTQYGDKIEGWRIECTYSGSTNDWLWTVAPFNPLTNPFLTPSKTNNIMLHQDLYHSGSFEFYSYQWRSFSQAASHFTFDAKGIRIGDSAASISTWAWLSVAWMIAAWKNSTDNYIYMYASWNNSDRNRHYEIMWNSQLAIGTRGWAFIYFTQITGTYNSNLEYWAWSATNSYSPWTCEAGGDKIEVVAGRGQYTLPGRWTDNWWLGLVVIWEGWWGTETCSAPEGHQRSSVNVVWGMGIQDVYESLMVGVNTDHPNATLDVNGSIRIWSNCIPLNTRCSRDKVWTIMYVEDDSDWYLILCKLEDGVYTRYDMLNWVSNVDLSFWSLWDWDRECELPKPNPWNYPRGQAQLSDPLPAQY